MIKKKNKTRKRREILNYILDLERYTLDNGKFGNMTRYVFFNVHSDNYGMGDDIR